MSVKSTDTLRSFICKTGAIPYISINTVFFLPLLNTDIFKVIIRSCGNCMAKKLSSTETVFL